jgi:Heterokaryon incompatibility protein (HET)
VRLLSHSITSFQKGISITQLPRTFAEAIEVCQQLGLSYIWIDALCIIQDSEDDWAQEAARMRDIYSNSCLTIAATASTDGSGGLFSPRDTGIAMPFHAITKWSTFDPGMYICSLRYDGGLYDRSVNVAPLNQRAWVLQERLLSRCVLHFAENQIYWQCATLTASEINPQGIRMGGSGKNLMNWTMIQDGAEHERRNQRQMDYLVALYGVTRTEIPVSFTGRWMTIVMTYSKAKLTYCADKLVALSGLVRRMSEIGDQQPQDYLAGLWRFNLGVQLLWYTSRSPRPEQYRAPSWSWASVDGRVDFRPGAKPRGPLVLKIIDAATETKMDPFGQVVGGYLRVQGRLWQALVVKHLPPEIKLEKSMVIIDCQFDIAELQGAIHIYLLPICLLGRDVHGILLEPTGNRKGQFQRVGRFEIRDSPTRERSAERILSAILQAEKALEENLYKNFDGIDQYSIEII